MSYPYPQDRHRDRKEKGDQPYKDATEIFSQNQAELERDAGRLDDERVQRGIPELERDAEDRFEAIAEDEAHDDRTT